MPTDDDLPPLPPVQPGLYRHYKGGLYRLIGAARHSETLAPLVLYQPLYGRGELWVRPFGMFFENVVVDGRAQPRFAPVEPPIDPPNEPPIDPLLEPPI